MNTDTKNEQDERSPATPCRKCGALLGWIEGCGYPGEGDYEAARELTECECTRSRDEAIGYLVEALCVLTDAHYEAMSKEQQIITHKISRLSQKLSNDKLKLKANKVCECKGASK